MFSAIQFVYDQRMVTLVAVGLVAAMLVAIIAFVLYLAIAELIRRK